MPAQAWVTLIVGIVATAGVVVTWQQKNVADRRSEWWRRTAWAFERSLGDGREEAELGWELLATLVGSRLATKGDSEVVQVVGQHFALRGYDDPEGGRPNDPAGDTKAGP